MDSSATGEAAVRLFGIVLAVLPLVISFTCGYGVRALKSQWRRAIERERFFQSHPEARIDYVPKLVDRLLANLQKSKLRQPLNRRWHDRQSVKQLAEDIASDENVTRLLLQEIAAQFRSRPKNKDPTRKLH